MNPIKRSRGAAELSQVGLAKRLNLSKQYINRVEQGLYDEINPKLMKFMVSTLHTTPTKIHKEYGDWRHQRRESTIESRDVTPIEFEYNIPSYIQFGNWRAMYWLTAHAFCVEMCIHPQAVSDYEDGYRKTMPKSLKRVMEEFKLLPAEMNV